MRIAFVLSKFPALSETFILNQITGLIDLGHEVDIYANCPRSPGENVHGEVERYELLSRVSYLHHVPRNAFTRIAKGLLLLLRNCHKDPSFVLSSLNFFRYGRAAISLRMLYLVTSFAGKRYDILQCHYGDNGSLGALLKEAGFEAKLVTMFHGWDIRIAVEKNSKRYHHLFRRGDCFLSISNYNYQNLLKLGANPQKILNHPVGIDLRRFSSSKTRSVPDPSQPLIVLTVARLVPEKGLQYGIHAIQELISTHPRLNLHYLIIGQGPLEKKVKALIRELHLEEHIHLLGGMDQSEVIKKMEESHLFLLPSLSEALPVVLMEAQAMELPVIATKVGSVDQVLKDGESGFLAPPGDSKALAERLGYLIDHPESWHEMGKAGRQLVEKHFDIEKLNRRLVRIYERLLR